MFIKGEFVESKTDKWVDLHNPVSCMYKCVYVSALMLWIMLICYPSWRNFCKCTYQGDSLRGSVLLYTIICSHSQNPPTRVWWHVIESLTVTNSFFSHQSDCISLLTCITMYTSVCHCMWKFSTMLWSSSHIISV